MIIYFTDLFILYIFIQNAYANKKVFYKKGQQIMFNGSNCDRKSQLSGILTEPLNPRERCHIKLLKVKLRKIQAAEIETPVNGPGCGIGQVKGSRDAIRKG